MTKDMNRVRWSGDRIGRLSLRLDAAYCALLGAGVALAAPVLATPLGLSVWAVAVVGIAVVVWAAFIVVMLRRLELRTALRFVMVANLIAAGGVAAFSTFGATLLILLSLLALAFDVALFAGSQAFALRRLRVA